MMNVNKYPMLDHGAFLEFSINARPFYYVTPITAHKSHTHKHIRRIVSLIAYLTVSFSALCFMAPVHSGMPLWSFKPDSNFPPNTVVAPNDTVIVKYIITNNSSKPHNLVISPQTGVSQRASCAAGGKGSCVLQLAIAGNVLPASGLSGGPRLCQSNPDGKTPNLSQCYQPSAADTLAVKMIPNHLVMLPVPHQDATANESFIYHLKSAVQYYDENKAAGLPAQGLVNPVEQDGLRFDERSFSIIGKPKQAKIYVFSVAAKNKYGSTKPVNFVVNACINIKDRPVFKQRPFLASALVNQKYKMNLLELIEPQVGFMVNNQVSFRIVPNPDNPDWLHISSDDTIRLEGRASLAETRQEIALTLIASSNTGGDSLPFRVHIPIVYDPEKKPVIHPFSLQGIAGTEFYEDLSGHISSPIHDSDLHLILDKVEPFAPWLRVSSENPGTLKGLIPDTAVGQVYVLTLRANTPNGGSSDPLIVPLQINLNPKMVPRFKSEDVLLPLFYPGQPFLYDFVANNDIYPEYNDAPYQMQFAEGFAPPPWLRIEENKLISQMLPDDLNEDIELPIVIKNTPGGTSRQYFLKVYTK